MRRAWVAGLLILLLLGCSMAETPTTVPTRRPTSTIEARQRTATPTRPRPTATPYPAPADDVADVDGDFFANEIEKQLGANPFVNECLEQVGCGSNTAIKNGLLNVLLVVDSSAKMADRMGEGTVMQWVRAAVDYYVNGLPSPVQIGLIAYGHESSPDEAGRATSCGAATLFHPVSPLDPAMMKYKMRVFEPKGWAPMALALESANNAFLGKEGQINRLLLVTGGGDTCGGKVCEAAQKLKRGQFAITVDVVALNVEESAQAELRCITNSTGGLFFDVGSSGEINQTWTTLLDRDKKWFKASSCTARVKSEYVACLQDRRQKLQEWSNKSGWINRHINQFVELNRRLVDEQLLLSLPNVTPEVTLEASPVATP